MATLDYRKSQPGDHSPADCAEARRIADSLYAGLTAAWKRSHQEWSDMRDEYDRYAGGYHAGWGICRTGESVPREVHDRELNEHRESYLSHLSPFVRRALAGELPAKETFR